MTLSLTTLGAACGVAIGAALALGLAPAASAETNFLSANKVACTPDQMIECSADNKCESKPASAKDKSELLVLDFAAKSAAIRTGGDTKPFGNIVDDKASGDVRSFGISEGGNSLKATLSKGGKLTLFLDGDKSKAEATCVGES